MIYIVKVHYDSDSNGNEYISKLKYTNTLESCTESICTKKEMINFINSNPNCTKTKYVKYGFWHIGEDVRVVDNSYLRTDGNNIKADNLGELPEF